MSPLSADAQAVYVDQSHVLDLSIFDVFNPFLIIRKTMRTNLMSSALQPLDIQAAKGAEESAVASIPAPVDTLTPIVTTSSVLGITFKDGILMVADTLACYGRMARFKETSRFFQLGCHTAIATTGDYSDHQYMERALTQYAMKDFLHDDHCVKGPHQYAALLSRLMYQRRNQFNPWWLSVIVGGYQPEKASLSAHLSSFSDAAFAMVVEGDAEERQKSKTFTLGYVDMHGTFFEEEVVATGLGRYFAITLMRARHRPTMTEEEARSLLEECMRVLFYRDCGASNRIQFTKITKEGVQVETPYCLSSNWDYHSYTMKTLDMGLAGSAW